MIKLCFVTTYCWYWTITAVFGDIVWTKYVTSKPYIDTQMLTGLEDFFDPIYYSKDSSFLWARTQCSYVCSSNSSCEAFTFYETDTHFVCELQPDHFCGNKTTKALLSLANSSVWFKQRPETDFTCFSSMLTGLQCGGARYGCLGTLPHCYDCPKTCIDCFNRKLITLSNRCVLWPDGDNNYTARPIFVYCNKTRTVLIQRTVNFVAGFVRTYRMSFVNVNRLYRLNVYNLLTFAFNDGSHTTTSAVYDNWSIEANGTLSNITWTNMVVQDTVLAGDIFQLNGKRLQPVPFVIVTDDKYYCGSFWQLDLKNATYCPGGKLSIFGTAVYLPPKSPSSNIKIISTGIRFPGMSPKDFFTFTSVELTNN